MREKWNWRPRFLLVNSNFGQISLSSWWNPYFCWWDRDSRVKSKICWNPIFFACKNPVSSWSTPQFVADEIPFHARPSCIFRPACRRQSLWRGGGWPPRGRCRHFRKVGSSVGWQGDLELLHQDLRDEGQNPDVCRLEFDWKNKIIGGFFGNYRGFSASVIEIFYGRRGLLSIYISHGFAVQNLVGVFYPQVCRSSSRLFPFEQFFSELNCQKVSMDQQVWDSLLHHGATVGPSLLYLGQQLVQNPKQMGDIKQNKRHTTHRS